MQALRSVFLGRGFSTATAAPQASSSSNATRQVTCMAKKKARAGPGAASLSLHVQHTPSASAMWSKQCGTAREGGGGGRRAHAFARRDVAHLLLLPSLLQGVRMIVSTVQVTANSAAHWPPGPVSDYIRGRRSAVQPQGNNGQFVVAGDAGVH
jgi:hypothetical protein